MAKGANGYVTVNVGVANGHGKVGNGHGLSEDERSRRARRLRKDGWSYRRIAATLDMTYASVCRLLDGEEARLPMAPAVMPLPRRSAPAAAPQQPRPPAGDGGLSTPTALVRLEEMSAQITQLQQRLDMVLAVNETLRQNMARMERTMVATLLSEHRALGQRLHAAMKALLERMIPSSLRAWTGLPEKRDDQS